MDGPEAPSRGGAAPWLIALATAAAGAAAASVLAGLLTLAGAAVVVAGAALVYADLRAASIRQRFAHAVVERAADGAILGAVAWEFVQSDTLISAGALTALSFAYLAAYLRAKGRGLGFRVSDPVLERYMHFAFVSASLLVAQGRLLLWLAAVVDAQAAIRLAVAVGRQREA
jgi:hypothetical protein